MSNASLVGTDCHVYGGSSPIETYTAITGTPEIFTRFFYIFRVGPIVVKLYAAEGAFAQDAGNLLTTDQVKAAADHIVGRIGSVVGGGANTRHLPWWRKILG